jgi:hypothetical protein
VGGRIDSERIASVSVARTMAGNYLDRSMYLGCSHPECALSLFGYYKIRASAAEKNKKSCSAVHCRLDERTEVAMQVEVVRMALDIDQRY